MYLEGTQGNRIVLLIKLLYLHINIGVNISLSGVMGEDHIEYI